MSSSSEAAGSMAVAGPPAGQGWRAMVLAVARVLLPVLLALVVGALVLLALGKDPLAYYGYVLNRGLLTWSGLQETITRMAPLLMISAGLIVAFRAGVWNLGVDGQFLLAAVIGFVPGSKRGKLTFLRHPGRARRATIRGLNTGGADELGSRLSASLRPG